MLHRFTAAKSLGPRYACAWLQKTSILDIYSSYVYLSFPSDIIFFPFSKSVFLAMHIRAQHPRILGLFHHSVSTSSYFLFLFCKKKAVILYILNGIVKHYEHTNSWPTQIFFCWRSLWFWHHNALFCVSNLCFSATLLTLFISIIINQSINYIYIYNIKLYISVCV